MTNKEEALRMALEALKHEANVGNDDAYRRERDAISEALAEQPAQQKDIDWKDQYEKQKRRAEMWVAKYEADIKPLEKAGPVTAQQQEMVQTEPNFEQRKQILDNLDRCLHRDSKHEFLRVWIRDWTNHKLSKQTQQQEPVAWLHNGKLHEFDPSDWATGPVTPLYTSPPAKPWVNPSLKEYEDIMLANITPRTNDERDGIMGALSDMVVLLQERNT